MKKIIKYMCLFIFLLFTVKSDAQIPFVEGYKYEVPFDTISKIKKQNDLLEFGIDISHYQGIINFDSLKNNNIEFIIIKATEGVDLIDNKFKRNWEETKRIGITKGAYHFFRPNVNGKNQAELYLKVVKLDSNSFNPIIDVEYVKSYHRTQRNVYLKNFNDFMEQIYNKTGKYPIIYTTANFWQKFYSPYIKKHNYYLWIASYRDIKHEIPHSVLGFDSWMIWQYTNKGVVPGIRGFVDMNILYKENKKIILFK